MNKYNAIVVGSGLSGSVMAERMANELGWNILMLEKRDHIGGNCFDEYDESGVLVHKYGPHLFHTDNERVWNYLSKFTEWLPYEHRVLCKVGNELLPIPFNLTSIKKCFDCEKSKQIIYELEKFYGLNSRIPILQLRSSKSLLLQELADFVYKNVFLNYTSKQWGVEPDKISPEVTARVPIVVSTDDRYFTDYYQAVPLKGYTAVFEKMLSNHKITINLSTSMEERVSLDIENNLIYLDGEIFDGILIYTGMIDELLKSKDKLPYRSLRFKHVHKIQEYFQKVATVNYPNEEKFTRITEFKHLTNQKHSGTSIVYEYPCEYVPETDLEPYYPIFTTEAKSIYDDLKSRLINFSNLLILGRLAEYKYFDMDDAVANALDSFDILRRKVTNHR